MSRSRANIPSQYAEELGINGKADDPASPKEERALTDFGNAERFVDDHGEQMRYCPPWGKWLVYDGRRWVPDESAEAERMMKATVRDIYAEVAKEEDDKKRKAIDDHARRSESKKRITDALYLARSEPGVPVLPEELDAAPNLLNAANGTVDLRTGELREHRREDLITKLAAGYDPNAEAPAFEAFLEKILPSAALRGFVQKAIGYAASGAATEEVLVILHGAGANGKSTLVTAVMEALGDYAMQAPPDLLMVKRGAHPTELADLFRGRFVASVESDEGRRLAEGLVKQITGRDRIKARRMREDFWEFDPTHTVFLATNHRPEVRGTDHAIWRRIKLVPFDVTIPDAEQDKKLPEKLRAELPGILAWIVRGYRDYQREGLGAPREVQDATEGYRTDMDVLAAFIADECVVHQRASAGATRLYTAYKDWCEENGEKAGTQTRFGLRLKERGFVSERSGTVTWHGIGLKADGSPDPGRDPGRLGTKNHPDRSEPGHPGPVNRPDGGDPGRLEPNRPSGESGIHTPNAPNTDETPGQLVPENGLNGINPPHEAFMPKKGPNRPNRPEPSGPDELEVVDKASPDARPWPHHPVGCPCPECARRFSRPPAHGDDPGPEPYTDGDEVVF